MIKLMVMVYLKQKMEISTKDNGKTIKEKAKENSFGVMVTILMVSGRITKDQDMVFKSL